MNGHRLVRRFASAALLAGSALVVPAALEAACQMQEYWTTGGYRERITCCGETACCTTIWSGSTLVSKSCF